MSSNMADVPNRTLDKMNASQQQRLHEAKEVAQEILVGLEGLQERSRAASPLPWRRFKYKVLEDGHRLILDTNIKQKVEKTIFERQREISKSVSSAWPIALPCELYRVETTRIVVDISRDEGAIITLRHGPRQTHSWFPNTPDGKANVIAAMTRQALHARLVR